MFSEMLGIAMPGPGAKRFSARAGLVRPAWSRGLWNSPPPVFRGGSGTSKDAFRTWPGQRPAQLLHQQRPTRGLPAQPGTTACVQATFKCAAQLHRGTSDQGAAGHDPPRATAGAARPPRTAAGPSRAAGPPPAPPSAASPASPATPT